MHVSSRGSEGAIATENDPDDKETAGATDKFTVEAVAQDGAVVEGGREGKAGDNGVLEEETKACFGTTDLGGSGGTKAAAAKAGDGAGAATWEDKGAAGAAGCEPGGCVPDAVAAWEEEGGAGSFAGELP